MSDIEVSEVKSRRERDAFIKFPWQIYANDPAWVPPLIIERKEFLNRDRHPFYKHGDAALFLARKNGEIVGRIMASDDPNYNALHQANVGCFGLFESIADRDVADALFGAAAIWLRRKGRTEIMGPIDYSINYVCGLLIEGFQFPPTILTAHNPPYYRELIESCGFTKAKDWYAWWFADPSKAVTQLRRLATRVQKRWSVAIRPANLRDLRGESRRLREIFNQAWAKNWGFVPFTEAEMDFMTKELKPLIVPEFAWVAESRQRACRIHIVFAGHQRCVARSQRSTHSFWPADRVDQTVALQKACPERAPHRSRRSRKISPRRTSRDARAARHRGNNGQTRNHRRVEHDA